MNKRSVLVSITVVGVVAGLLAWQMRPKPDIATATTSGGTLGQGGEVALPYGRSAAAPIEPLPQPMSAQMLRAEYFAAKDKFAFYQRMKSRSEPEAKYLAYRAVQDCMMVLGSIKDPNDFEFGFRQALSSTSTSASREKRERAFAELKQLCGGFTRPEVLPLQEANILVASAAAGGSVAARVAATKSKPGPDDVIAVRAAIEARDPLAFDEATLYFYTRNYMLNLGQEKPNTHVMHLAVEMAVCDVALTCGADHPVMRAACAYIGQCDEKDRRTAIVESHLAITKLSPEQYQQAIRIANLMTAKFYAGDAENLFRRFKQ